jgi:hypothetical protein
MNQSGMTEAQIKKQIKQPKIDYGTCNNTLRRLCKHGVLRRSVGVSVTSGIPSWHYYTIMNPYEVNEYIAIQEAKMQKHKTKHQLFGFGSTYNLSQAYQGGPLMIGLGAVSDELKGKCLIVNDSYEMITEEYQGVTLISFKRRPY